MEPSEFNFDESLLWNCQLEPELLQSLHKVAEIGLQSAEEKRWATQAELRRLFHLIYVWFQNFFSCTVALRVFSGPNASSWCSKMDRTKENLKSSIVTCVSSYGLPADIVICCYSTRKPANHSLHLCKCHSGKYAKHFFKNTQKLPRHDSAWHFYTLKCSQPL